MSQHLGNLLDLLSTPLEVRDEGWEGYFLNTFPNSFLTIPDPAPQVAYDRWPYLYAKVLPDSQEPAKKVLEWLASRGIGLVINGDKNVPDYVFSYGMIWNFLETGQFISETPEIPEGLWTLDKGTAIHTMAPDEKYLPPQVRTILKQFLADQGILTPKVLLVTDDKTPNKKNFDLCISLDSLGNPPPQEHAGIAEAFQWFLPPHYSLVLVRESGLPTFFLL